MSAIEKTKPVLERMLPRSTKTRCALAAAQDRSRSYLINEAIRNYIELHAYQDALVRQGLGRNATGPGGES